MSTFKVSNSKKNSANEGLEYPLSPFTLALNFAGSLTHLPIGPSASIFIPIISNSWPFSYIAVIILDIFAALALKRSLIIEGQMPAPFEFAWRNVDQTYMLGSQAIPGQNQTAPEPEESDDPDGPLFPPGISISLSLDTPIRTSRTNSTAVFIYQILDFPKVPCWVLMVCTSIIYSISYMYCRKRDKKK